ncbi:MAG: beta-N-acetylhexosaminidase [bacterium]
MNQIGRMLMVGFEGDEPTKEIEEMIKKDRLGGVILFARNIISAGQVKKLCSRLKAIAKASYVPPPLIAIDHEGGVVTRFTDEVTPLPGNMALGATRSTQYAYQAGQIAGRELLSLGIDINLAPVLDLATNPKTPLGVRSFGQEPELAAKLGAAMIKGMQSQGISATAKHFPGKGEASLDSHLELPIVTCSAERLEKTELHPFREAIKAGVDLVMTSHAVFTALDPTRPATLSGKILTNLLREKMNFKGVIITDDLEMGAITEIGVSEAAVMAVKAGADIVLICHGPDKQKAALETLRLAVERGEIPAERIKQSLSRIRRRRKAEGAPTSWVPGRADFTFDDPESAVWKMRREAVTLVKDEQKLIPLKAEPNQSMLIVSTTQSPLTMVEDTTKPPSRFNPPSAIPGTQEVGAPFAIRTAAIEIQPKKEAAEQVISLARKADATIFITCNAHRYDQQAQLVRDISTLKKPFIVVASREPYDLNAFPEVGTYLTTYCPHPFSLQSALEVIFGKFSPGGQLPVRLTGL